RVISSEAYNDSQCFRRSLPLESASSASRVRCALREALRLGPLQQIFGTATAQMLAAVPDHHLYIDVAGAIRDQEARKVGKLAMFADAAKRIALRPSFVAAFGAKLARCAFRRK